MHCYFVWADCSLFLLDGLWLYRSGLATNSASFTTLICLVFVLSAIRSVEDGLCIICCGFRLRRVVFPIAHV